NEIIRPIVAQERSAFNFREVMDSQKILLVNLSKGRLGDLNSSLIGLVIVGKLLMSALSRVDMQEERRKDFYLYIDEFQNVTTDSIATILSEARKYRLNLTITHQFIGQLKEEIKKAVFGNVGSMASFRIGTEDAEFLAKQYKPVFAEQDLLNIANRTCYLRMLINGQVAQPFNMKTYAPYRGDTQMAEVVKEMSRLKYGRPRAEVEQEILDRHNRVLV
ncbi:MAG: TraM recognition domain-containing protein, partial [Candidatus Sungbacteria bacterium]|nr:TraM recognition domain-containing protein [Candidatus Sungbacteria bacterium]